MPRDRSSGGSCAQCGQGRIVCSYNQFADATKRIDAWEHRCDNCGHRVTQAFRSDEPQVATTANPEVCPFCGRKPACLAVH